MEVGGQAGTAGGPAVRLGVRVGGGTAELVHCGDGLQAVLERTGPVQGEGRQARMQMNTGS